MNTKKEIGSWDHYWAKRNFKSKRHLYDLVASLYRKFILRPDLNHFVKKYFRPKGEALHAGCGGGEVDINTQNYLNITAMDFSKNALIKYKKRHGKNCRTVLGDIRNLKFKNSTFDGIYNLGVFEHFGMADINKILKGFNRILKKNGIIVIFWPPEYGISVFSFKVLVFILKNLFSMKNVEFHPPEPSRIKSKKEITKIFSNNGFKVIEYYFGVRDLFTNVAIVARKSKI